MTEAEFEKELIEHLTSIAGTKQWRYEEHIKTTEALWQNFKEILERHNQSTLDHPLSVVEFNQVKRIISDLHTPYEAGQFLYGLNGVSQIEIDLDDGRHIFLDVFDQKKIGAGDTVYQVVNQIYRPEVIAGRSECRFDVTLLINGLPIIQIEEKTDTVDIEKALNQMHQYIDENQYGDIFSTLQLLVAISPNNVKYMANTTVDKFNKDFAFNWQQENGEIIRNWKVFTEKFLSIPMAHQMSTNFMILDGSKNNQMLKVMRPYQVYATQKVIEGIKHTDFELGNSKIGYIWHTTGSGKTITSFKTAWLASRMPNVDKVVFVVDRIALTRQTSEEYQAYDPDTSFDENAKEGSVRGTENTNDLRRKLKSSDNGIIVTSVQKLNTLVNRNNFEAPKKNIVFVVDEAHRSTGGESFAYIQKAFKTAAWVGYTGTPMFDSNDNGLRTEDIFGPLLHAYTIKNAIVDKNVLGFKVDFETTLPPDQLRENYLPQFFRAKYPNWTQEEIAKKIENLNDDDIDDNVESGVYDENSEHVRLVVEDIFKNWRNRSNEGQYNALFTTHVGGGKASTPMAMMYFREFQKINAKRREEGLFTLKVAVTFSHNTSNDNNQLESNRGLLEAIQAYNEEFDQSFGLEDVSGYTQDVVSRLNRSAQDKKYLDICIVVDQLLTGFNAPELNTLYVDRTLKGAGLIQAYSRTNRIADMHTKPWGRIINYRWPAQNEKLMNEALAIYSNEDSACLSNEAQKELLQQDGLLAEDFDVLFEEVAEVISRLKEQSNDFTTIPNGEKAQEKMFEDLKRYSAGISKLKQYEPGTKGSLGHGFDYDNPDDLIVDLGMTPEQETMLTTVLSNELKQRLAKAKNVPLFQIELRMTHVKEVKVDYDYLSELIERLLNAVHEGKTDEAIQTKKEINQFANGLEDQAYARKIKNAAQAIYDGDFSVDNYPATLKDSTDVIQAANKLILDRRFDEFKIRWGLLDIITREEMHDLFSSHRYGMQDLDDAGRIREVISEGSLNYQVLAHDKEVCSLSKIKYRNQLREAFYTLADELADN